MKRIVKPGLIAASLGLLGAGCGPAPWYQQHDRPFVAPADEDESDHEPAMDGHAPQSGQQPIRIVHTHRADAYYVIDPNRRLCFFHQGKAMSPVDCALLPEAQDLVRRPAAEGPAEEPRTASSSRRYEEASEDEPVEPEYADDDPVEPEPEPEPEPVGEVEPETPAPPPAPVPIDKPKPADLGPTPTDDERRRFTLAYIAVTCDGRKGGTVEPAKHIAEANLTLARYSQIEGWFASQDKAWRSLTLAARAACPD